mmetsp:Transcript_12297/g.33915  ORF Transcript_12297/g.33915 Transcript_12297/m.33915 type:complete len:87 (-) Transcript_12297:93-353(-)
MASEKQEQRAYLSSNQVNPPVLACGQGQPGVNLLYSTLIQQQSLQLPTKPRFRGVRTLEAFYAYTERKIGHRFGAEALIGRPSSGR